MFRPARMTRIVVGGHRDRLEEVVATLHEEGVLHLEDFHDPTDVTVLGEPLEAGAEVSDLLVRTRGLQKALDVETESPKEMPPEEPATMVAAAEKATRAALEQQGDLRARVAALQAERDMLVPLAGMDVDLGALRTVRAVRASLGTLRDDPRPGLEAAGIGHETTVQKTPLGLTAVVIVRSADGAAADKALAEAGFVPIQLPGDADGTPSQRLERLDEAIGSLQPELAGVDEQVATLRRQWGAKLASLEVRLAAEAQMTAAPLQFGVTANTFHLEGWLPRARVNNLRNVLAHRFGDGLYMEDVGDAPLRHAPADHIEQGHHQHEHEGHGHGPDHAGAPDEHEGAHDVAVEDEAPTSLRNKGAAKPYEFLLSLLALPRYKELDPTKLIAIFFPLFFGLMVGDVVIGLLIMLVAWYLVNHRIFGIGGKGVARPMMWGGLWAVIIGLLIFGEGLGLHFVLSEEAVADGEHSWETAFGIHFPEEGFFHKTGGEAHAADAAVEAGAITTHASETTLLPPILQPHGGAHLMLGPVQLGHYSKIHDVEALLIWSVLIGLAHIVLGLVLGVRNVYASHGLKLAIQEKVSWLLIIASAGAIVVGMQGGNALLQWAGVGVFVAAVVLLWMGVQHTIGVGFIAILEIPSLLGNLLSYTRLAAIGASKAGMAIAFATIGFELIGGAVGIVVYLVAALLITVLAILAGFLQSLRLQFVEFFSKFYEGGGRPYLPFGRRAPRPPSTP